MMWGFGLAFMSLWCSHDVSCLGRGHFVRRCFGALTLSPKHCGCFCGCGEGMSVKSCGLKA